MAEVILDNLTKVYSNGVEAVRDFSLTVADGEMMVVVGPSGSGKTTTLRLIAGLETPSAGTVSINGKPVNRLPPRHRDVALAFQRNSLYPQLNVRQNLAFSGSLRDKRWWGRSLLNIFRAESRDEEIPRRVQETAKTLGLEEVLERYPSQLSGGEQQRVALGRTLVRRPGVYLWDEPLSNLDGPLRADLRRQLHLLQKALRATIIYVTHDQAEALALADRLVVLQKGRIQQVGRPADLYNQPQNLFVAEFLGYPPMNLLAGQVRETEGIWSFSGEEIILPLPHFKGARYLPANSQVTLGIRAENLSLRQDADNAKLKLSMTVSLVEHAGSHSLLTCRRGPSQVVVKIDGFCDVLPGQDVEVYWTMSRIHLFDGKSGRALAFG